MKQLWGGLGTIIFWLLWPVWYVYLRISGTRSRVLVIVNNEVLLIQNWLSVKHFSLPGGGSKRHEATITAAIRELSEETGIDVAESSLVRLGSYVHTQYNLRYNEDFFVLRLNEKPVIRVQKLEVFSALWVPLDKVSNLHLDEDTLFALKRYHPSEQASLL